MENCHDSDDEEYSNEEKGNCDEKEDFDEGEYDFFFVEDEEEYNDKDVMI